ncbi:DUF3857 domain-containing protein [Pontimicrobium sp. IMCC45349]|uniref:DUF3857 domain-containing protein n=1 Tax=Pontimicrobium sp. IMCC45349 TaxID=3391574 RepID=UPI00399F142B
MKHFFSALILFLLNLHLTTAQNKFETTSFQVTSGDLLTNVYTADSTANALVIYEKGNSYIDEETFNVVTEIKRKIKILKKEAFNQGTIEILLYNNDSKNKEKIKKIVAYTHNINNSIGTKQRLNKDDIFTEVINKNYTQVKFTLPDLKEGSVITYSYTLVSPFIFNYHSWSFQDDIPKLYSEYTTSIPANYKYHIKLVGNQKLSKHDQILKKNCIKRLNGATADCTETIYVMENIPALIEESYMTTASNYLSRIEYELEHTERFDGHVSYYTKTWESVDKELRTDESLGKQLKKSVNPEDILPSEIINETDKLAKAKAIYNFVIDNYTWNNKTRLFQDVSVKRLIKEKSGNSSELNILLYNLLNKSDINVNAVILSTRQSGFLTKLYPVLSEFNYLIVKTVINNKTYLLDSTNPYQAFGEIPFRCLNNDGRQLDLKNGSKWIDIHASTPTATMHQVSLNINNNVLNGNIKSRYTSYNATNKKENYYSNPDSYVKNFEDTYVDIIVNEHDVSSNGIHDIYFQETYDIEFNDNNIVGDKIYLDPFIYKFFTENPFKLQQRTYPIEFGHKNFMSYTLKLNIGEDYSVVELPKNQIIKLPNNAGDFSFSVSQIGNDINVTSKINFKEPAYPSEYYPYLKEFMSKIVEVYSNTIIVIEKNK